MKKILFSILTLVLVGAGCSTIGGQDITYAFHMSSEISSPANAASELNTNIWGDFTIRPNGDITGTGTIAYEYAEPCEWIPPYPNDGPPPHCIITDLKDGSFSVTGSVVEYTGAGDEIDDGIFKTLAEIGIENMSTAPRTVELTFHLEEAPVEEMLFWGLSDGNVESGSTGAAHLGLAEAMLFETPFQISPFIGEEENDSEEVQAAHMKLFAGEGQVASSHGVLKIYTSIPDSFEGTRREVIENASGNLDLETYEAYLN